MIRQILLALGVLLCSFGLGMESHCSADHYPIKAGIIYSDDGDSDYNFYSSYLHGAAELTRAQGEFLVLREMANVLHQKARIEALAAHKEELKHIEWVRDHNAARFERERIRLKQASEARALRDPQISEILDASTLNTFFRDLKNKANAQDAASIRIPEECLPHIHFSVEGNRGNIGLLKRDKLPWPLPFWRPEFKSEREAFDEQFQQLRGQIAGSGVDKSQLEALHLRIGAIQDRLRQQCRAGRDDLWPPSTYITAQGFLRQMKDAVSMLEQEEVALLLQTPNCHTIQELIVYLRDKGLRFAPATNGTERFYIALHRAFASEFTRVNTSR